MIKRCIVMICICAAACAPGAPNVDSSTESMDESAESAESIESLRAHRAPVLRNRAIWTVSGARTDDGGCFGDAAVVGDFDGDGRRDVIVAEGECDDADLPYAGRLAVYRGGRHLPSTTAVWTELDWGVLDDFTNGLKLVAGDIDGDRRDDLVVVSQVGVQVFTGITQLRTPLAPSFQFPPGAFTGAVVADVNGDRRDDLITTRGGTSTVWLSTPGAAGGPFTAGRVLTRARVTAAVDTNRDGKADLLTRGTTSQLWLGCRAYEPGCDGGLRAEPAFATTQVVSGMIPDLNHDGLSEAIVMPPGINGGIVGGRAFLHLSDRTTGGLSASPAWSMLGDSGYPVFGARVVVPGDLDGDHRPTEFLLQASGRVYAFFPRLDELATMEAGFAWPRLDTLREQLSSDELRFGSSQTMSAAGDVNRDGLDDLVLADPPLFGQTRPGSVHLLSGGRPPHQAPPFLRGALTCDLPENGKADLTIDAPALARSLYIHHREFAADACEVIDGCVAAPGPRRLLRFAASVANFGGGPAIIPGQDTAPELYHLNACTQSFELDGFAEYQLFNAADQSLAIGRKQSVFLVDIAPNCINAPPSMLDFTTQRLSPGWGDVYDARTACQWIDVTDVPDGNYQLRVAIDVQGLVDQDDILPDSATFNIALRGDQVDLLP